MLFVGMGNATRVSKCSIFLVIITVLIVVGVLLGVFLTKDTMGDQSESGVELSFKIDEASNTFLMNGEPFQYVAGSFHYFRALPQTWRRKLQTMKVAGINAVDIYIHWTLHNPKDQIYNFQGVADVEEMIKIASEEGLYIILRPGPYICSELDNGGLPYWLANKYPGIKVRTSDKNFMYEVEKWWSELMPKFEKHWYGNGGKIIMVQLENEYGAFKKCDKDYLNFLRDETEKYVNGKALLFTVDGTNGEELECGKIEGVFSTVDFGISNQTQIEYYFEKLRKVQPTGPLVNTEFYTGWYTHWQEPKERRSADLIADTLRIMLEMKANLGFYMFFGGTNFGFWAGANEMGLGNYMADVTSYDYDAPMDEAGDTTEKFFKIRDVIKDFYKVPDLETLPEKISKIILPNITMRAMGSILSDKGRHILGTYPIKTDHPLTFEEFNQFSGFLLYEANLPKFSRDPAKLLIEDLRDRAYIFVDDELIGVLSRENMIKSLPINAGSGNKISILVENQGRIDYQVDEDYKGIRGQVLLQTYHPDRETFEALSNWTITGYPFDDYFQLLDFVLHRKHESFSTANILSEGPIVLYQQFELSEIGDTYWDTTGWGKGFIFINGFNLGRYWPLVGPQITIYIPKELLNLGLNTILIVEYQKIPNDMSVRFTDKAKLDNN